MFLIEDNETLADIWNALINLVGIAMLIGVLRSLIRRWRRATRPERRLYAPMYAAGIALMIALIGQLSLQSAGSDGARWTWPSSSRWCRLRWCRTCSSERSCAAASSRAAR